jgi:cytochrome P450
MDRCARRYGEAFTITFAPSGRKLVLLSDPQAVKAVFTAPPEVAPSAAGDSPIAPVMGPSSVITLIGPEHMRQRKLLLPPFHGERMREYEDVIVQATRRSMREWPLGEPMRLDARTRAITLEVILRAVFGIEAERMERLRSAISGLLTPAQLPQLLLFALRRPTGERPTGQIGRGLDHLDEVIYEELARRRQQPDLAERTDILSLLMLARDEDGQAMTDAELRDELVTLLLAGHETTASTLSWAFYLIDQNPEVGERLREEARSVLGERLPEFEDLHRLEYTTMVVEETMRLYPPVWMLSRIAQGPDTIAGYRIPAGADVVVCPYTLHRHPGFWDSPERFDPERFDRQQRAQRPRYAYVPFGAGPRFCVGNHLGMMEAVFVIAMVMREMRLVLPEGESAVPEPMLSLRVRGGLRMSVRR